jgi:Ca2+-binding EF-hand superfamily protein
VSAIIEREVELTRRLDLLKRDLEVRHDFTPFAAFKSIDRHSEGAINSRNLTHFMSAQGYYPTEKETLNIIRRMDTSCAAAVSYNDFADYLRGHGSAEACSPLPRSSSVERTRSPSKLEIESPKRSSSANRTSPVKRRSSGASACKPVIVKKKLCCDVCTIKCYPASCIGDCCDDCVCYPYVRPSLCWPYYSPYCRTYIPYCAPVRCSSPVRCISPVRRSGLPLCSGQEYDLVRALHDIIKEERDLESAKIAMARRSDFNFNDAFKILDPLSRGFINLADLRDGLSSIGVYPSSSDMELFIKRYEKYGARNVRYAEFCEAFTPKTDSYLASELNRRRSNYFTQTRYSQRDECFAAGTRVEFRSLWNTHFKVEAMCESIRQRLRSIPHFDLYAAFLSCDLYDDGVISKDELRRFIDSRGFYVSDTDAKQLADKMDRDRDGVVSYGEVTCKALISY